MSFLKDFKDLKKDISMVADENENIGADSEMSEIVTGETENHNENLQRRNNVSQEAQNYISEDVTVIAGGAVVHGDMQSEGSMSVYGTVYGNITCDKKLIVAGQVSDNLNAGEIFINKAEIDGEVVSEGNLKIGSGSVVLGNIFGKTAVIAGAVKGEIDIHGPVIIDNTAVIKGNIKSSSVQINNGAVIEGYCTQCYHDVDVNDIFKDTFQEKMTEAPSVTEEEVSETHESSEEKEIES